jgi:hypothetical protein
MTTNLSNPDICAPGAKYDAGVCSSIFVLKNIIEAINKTKNEKIVIPNEIQNKEILDPTGYKTYLISKIKENVSEKCNNELCWLDESFVKQMTEKAKKEFLEYTFKPKSPQGRYTWLNTNDIDYVLDQHCKKKDNTKFISYGAMPMDFADLDYYEINKVSFDDLKQKGKTQIGFVLNLDDHNQSGSHWVGVFVDLDKKGVYYYDSVGKKPEERVVNFMNKVKNYFKQKGVSDKDIKIGHNKVQHQHGNTECGVYSIRFLLQMIKGINFDEFCNNKFSDKKINKCRRKYFRINPKN